MENFSYNKILLLLVLFLIPLVASPSPVWSADTITSIEFSGLSRIDDVALLRRISSQVGQTYSAANIKSDIKALFDTGLFEDVRVNKEGGRITFYLIERGVIGSISFRGNKKLKEKDLMAVVSMRENSELDQGKIIESVQALIKLYQEKNFNLAEVSYELIPLDTENNEFELIFDIQENKGIQIRRIHFVGNKAFSDKKLSKNMKTKEKSFLSFLNKSGKLDETALTDDIDRLTYFYMTEGYLKVKVGKPQVSLARGSDALYVTIPVYEGEKYKVELVDLRGDVITTPEEMRANLSLKAGDFYNRAIQDQDLMALTALYGDQAYAFASIYPNITTNDENKTAIVSYVIQKGPKVLVEKIIIKGNTITHDKVIRRELQLQENAPYSQSVLDYSKRRLMQLGYFSEVNFSIPRGKQDNGVNLVVEVKEKPTGSFSVGAGFSTLESFIFNASIQKENFFGRGIRGGVMTNLSKLRQEFALNAVDNYFLDTKWIVGLNVRRFASALNRDFDQKSFGGTLTFGRELFPFFFVNIGYNIDDISTENFSSSVPDFFKKSSSGLTSSLINSVSYDNRDNRVQTTKGVYTIASSEYAGNGLGGDNNYWKMSLDARYYMKMPLKTVLKARAFGSYVNSLSDTPVPLFERAFLGGPNTLRGFDLNSIGPELRIPSSATGPDRKFTYGGNRMLLFNLEYEMPVYEPAGLRAVVFADAGQAFAETESISLSSLRSNYGFGLRWNSPFGPMRFEWGFPVNKKSDESFSVFNFSIGQSF